MRNAYADSQNPAIMEPSEEKKKIMSAKIMGEKEEHVAQPYLSVRRIRKHLSLFILWHRPARERVNLLRVCLLVVPLRALGQISPFSSRCHWNQKILHT